MSFAPPQRKPQVDRESPRDAKLARGAEPSRPVEVNAVRPLHLHLGTPGPVATPFPVGATTGRLQASLEVSSPGDPLEIEAERVADQILRMPEPSGASADVPPPPRRAASAGRAPCDVVVQRACAQCRERGDEDEPTGSIQRRSDGAAHDATSRGYVAPSFVATLGAARAAGGEALPGALRTSMEARFGHDFEPVRVHRDTRADTLTRSVSARAFTLGHDIFFRAGAFDPASLTGQRLLAHELTHVLQQQSGLARALAPRPHEHAPGGPAPRAPAPVFPAPAELASVARVQQHLPAGTLARDDDESDSGVLDCLWGIVAGEFIEDPGLCQIIFETLVGLIPYVDQAMDARDLVAHAYYIGWGGQEDDVLRWVGVVFTLLGIIPEVGTLIKGASKLIRRYLEPILNAAGDVLRVIEPHLRRWGIDLSRRAGDLIQQLEELVRRNWDRAKTSALEAWDALVAWFRQQIDRIPAFTARVSDTVRQLREGVERLVTSSRTMLESAFRRARKILDDLLVEVGSRFGPRRVELTGTADAAHEIAQARRLGFIEGGGEFEFLGNSQQGIEGFLRRRGGGPDVPVSMKDFSSTGRLPSIIGRINRNARQVQAAGHAGDALLYATVRQTTTDDLLTFINNGPLLNMPNEGVFRRLIFDTADGMVEVTSTGARRIR